MKRCPACMQWNTIWDYIEEKYKCMNCKMEFGGTEQEDDYLFG